MTKTGDWAGRKARVPVVGGGVVQVDNRAQLRAKQGSAPRPAKYWLDEIEDDPGATHP